MAVSEVKLIKLHLEVIGPQNKPITASVYAKLLSMMVVRRFIANSAVLQEYPATLREVLSLIRCDYHTDRYLIGIGYDAKSGQQSLLFKNLLDKEYGVNGREIRIIRYALEQLVEFIKEGK